MPIYLVKMRENDHELLRAYVEKCSEDSFTALVQSHLNLVYSAALRQVRSSHLAEEVAQCVFADLARNASRLAPGTILTAWLYQVTRLTAIDVVRRETRRQLREQIAAEMNANNQADPAWTHLEPLLDEAMHNLDDTDRAAILLRYFENKSLREVGAALGISDDAAQKRVTRAVDRLHGFFQKRGITIAASGLVVLISANAVQSAPAGLAIAVSTSALVGATIVTATTTTAAKTIAMTTLQKTLIVSSLAATIGIATYKAHQASSLQTQVETLEQKQTALVSQMAVLQQQHDEATNRLVALSEENTRLTSNQNSTELLRLRGEVARLRSERQSVPRNKVMLDSNDPAMQAFMSARAIAEKITEAQARMPEKFIPEQKLLTDVDWLSSTKEAKFDTDEDVRKTLRKVRSLAKNRLPMGSSLSSYAQANNGRLPDSLPQLKPYFTSALGKTQLDDADVDAILNRYTLLRTGNVSDYPPGTWFVAEKSPVDKDYDSRAKFGIGTSTVLDTGIGENGDPDDPSY